MIHQINISVHVAAGTIALVLGIILLLGRKGTYFHKKAGLAFLCLLAIVTATGFTGWLFFRSNAFLLMLIILAGYNTFSGYRIVKRKQHRGTLFDLLAALVTLAMGLLYLFYLMNADANWAPSVIYPTVGGIVLVTLYDILKHLFLYDKIKTWWLYEHIYKIVSAFSALLSAFVGTMLPDFKPYSQVGPSTICIFLIIMFIWKEAKHSRRKTSLELKPS